MTSCPTGETLRRLGLEIADGPRFEELERHIEDCAACQSSLERLAQRSTAWRRSPAAVVAGAFGLPVIPGFVIEEELGRGSMGVVYRAWQTRLARRVALKVISGGPVDGARVRDYWLREAHSEARVRDPRVVQIHDVGEADGCLYLVLEYVPGGNLKDRLDGPLPARASAALTEKIAGGVAAVHRAGLLHLDLKPSNILIDSEPGTPWESISPRVADFGIARDADDSGMSRTTMRGPWGTPSYMAPEQVEPGRLAIGPASDVYALGAILYELLTGRPPFRAASLAETMDQIRHEEPAPPRRLNPAIPRDLDTICTTCLQKDPARRYSTADAMAEDLRRWRDGRPIAARPISIAERARRWAGRHPLTAALGTALAATVFLSIASLLLLWRRAERERRTAEDLRDVARANYEVASDSLREICEFTEQAALDPKTGWSFPAYLERALEQTRARQLELSRKNAMDSSGQEQLATVDLMLATVYRNRRTQEHVAQRLLHESITLWEACISRGADPGRGRAQQLQALDYLATLGSAVTDGLEIRRWDTASRAIYRRLCGNLQFTGRLFALSYRERQMADYLADSGQPERARQFLEEKLEFYESLLVSNPDSPDLLLARTLTLTALGKGGRISLEGRLGQGGDATPGGPVQTMLVLALAELTGRTFGLRALGRVVSRDRGPAEPDDAAWARQAVRFLAEQTEQLGLDRDVFLAAAWQLREMIACMASHMRWRGGHEEARRNARRFGALAAEFVRTCPGDVVPYLLTCEAHLQHAKNASRAGDREAVGRAIRLSLEAAERAQAVDPTSDDARQFLVDRRSRLARFESERIAGADPSRRPTLP